MTNRKTALNTCFKKEENTDLVVAALLKKDQKFIERRLTALNQEKEDLEEKLEARLQSELPIDQSTVEVLFAEINKVVATQNLYKEFSKTFLA